MVRRLLTLNGLATLGVVLYHATGWGFTAMFWWTNRYQPVAVPDFEQLGGAGYYFLRLIEQLVIFSIPAFLFVSGYFIAVAAGRTQKTISWQVVKSRILNLLIPFLLWSILILVAKIVQGAQYTAVEFITTILTGRTADPFYFVPTLVLLYLVSPFLVPLARNHWKMLLVVSLLVQSSMVLLRTLQLMPVDLSALNSVMFLTRSYLPFGFIFWFSSGIVIGFHLAELKSFFVRYRRVALGMAALFFIAGLFEWEIILRASGQAWIGPRETLVDNAYALAVLAAFIGFEQARLPFAGLLSQLGTRSFGVYLVHTPVLEYGARLIYHFLPWLLASQFLLQPVLFILGLGIPLLLMSAVNRSPARKYYGYLFG